MFKVFFFSEGEGGRGAGLVSGSYFQNKFQSPMAKRSGAALLVCNKLIKYVVHGPKIRAFLLILELIIAYMKKLDMKLLFYVSVLRPCC